MYNIGISPHVTGGVAHVPSEARPPRHFRLGSQGGLVPCSREHGGQSGGGFAPVVGEK